MVNAGWHYSWGNYVLIDHQNGLYSLYAHCSALYVAAGQGVSRGQQIAAVGRTGNASGNHLHLEVWTDPSGARWDDPVNEAPGPRQWGRRALFSMP